MKSNWITHKGKRVFIFDCSHFGSDTAALQAEANQVAEVVTKEPVGSVLAVSIVEGSIGTPANLRVLESLVSKTNRNIQKRAVVGISGIRRYLVDTINRVTNGKRFSTFDTLEQALDWLVM